MKQELNRSTLMSCRLILYFDFNSMQKDDRYEVVKTMIKTGKIVEFFQIFKYIPIRVVPDDLNSSSRRISNLIIEPGKLELAQMYALGELFDVEMDVVYSLSRKQFLSNPIKQKATKKRKSRTINR